MKNTREAEISLEEKKKDLRHEMEKEIHYGYRINRI